MYDEIKRHIEQRISEGQRFSIERSAIADTDGDRDTSLISAHVTSELDRHISEMYDDTDAAEAAAQPRDEVREFGGLRTRHQLEKHFVERLSVDIASTVKTFDFTVPSGTRVFGPPYDREWSEGNGFSFGGRVDGKAITIPKRNGFSAAGIGFYLTTNEPVLAAITPQGTYDWNWSAFENLPFARSRGGMGITIYTNSEPQPTMSRQPVLWSASGMTTFSGQKGSGRIAEAASPAFGLGTVPLAPALINMVPGSRYLVWVWCWQTSQLEEDDAFIAFLSFSMPFVTIDASPPILLH
ncbi:hypothetical protein C7B65_07310 [Phormidesmis priestleyi ULC007]|uniref:Uncharacterized protein n=1 Tax=Phormidesmis priestleyi ULC007 TaxID=1920490 RepID=A0A2T1DJQ9_9CYAN|nr:hypothetical protein [Phormidesmis priestleyi]PSB20695.1 hypothetical protein C7B65_07310 [Phormidesmis priestleyi ULC007]PZO47118.1 MAG: hypothetical protein DCF14_20775 [Phormidesmis priestleyi]